MSPGRPSTRFASPVREQSARKAAGPVAALEPRRGSGARPKDPYAVTVELELHLGTGLEAELIAHRLWDYDLALSAHPLSHTISITPADDA
jgi:hypothetical protein